MKNPDAPAVRRGEVTPIPDLQAAHDDRQHAAERHPPAFRRLLHQVELIQPPLMMKKTVGSGQADGLSVELPVLLRPVPLDRKGNAGKGDSVPRPIGSCCRPTIET